MPQVPLSEEAAERFLKAVLAAAKRKKKLAELARFVSYFTGAQQLQDLTGGKKSTLRTLVMITPANLEGVGLE